MKQSTRFTPALAAALFLALGLVAGAQSKPQGQPAGQQPAGQQPQAQQQAPDQSGQKPTFRAGINYVRVDVIATDKSGNPVNDLKQSDFKVTEDGKPQTIDSFKLIKITGELDNKDEQPRQIRSSFDEESEAARDDVRLFAIFLDDYHVRLGNSMAVREPLARFISGLGPADMVALMYPLTPLAGVTMSRNWGSLENAVRKFEGRKYDYRPRNDIEEQYSMYPATTVEQIRNQVSMSALKALVTHLGSLREGRKSVILVSEGYSNLLPPQLRDPIAAMPGIGNPGRLMPGLGQNDPNEERAQFLANADIQTDLREIYNAANRSNTAIYAVDPRRLATGEFDISDNVNAQTDRQYLQSTMDTLRVLAEQTDGRAIVNMNDLDTGLKQVVRDESAYYLLGYSSTQAPADGKFHEIKVRVDRPGVQVRARKGYWALTAEETKRALAPPKPGPPAAITRAIGSIAEPRRGRYIRDWIGTARGENGKTKVTFVWEPMPKMPGVEQETAARVSLVAMGPDGDAYFRGRVPDTTVASAATPANLPAGQEGTTPREPARVVFEAPPGKMQLRLSIEGTHSQVLDTDERDVIVPDLTSPQVQLSTPVVLHAANALEYRAIAKDADAVPTATREVRRTDRLLIRFDAYGPGGAAPDATARLLNRAGTPMATLPVQTFAAATRQVDLPLAGLASGEYLVEIKAKAAEGGEATSLIPLRIIS